MLESFGPLYGLALSRLAYTGGIAALLSLLIAVGELLRRFDGSGTIVGWQLRRTRPVGISGEHEPRDSDSAQWDRGIAELLTQTETQFGAA